MGDMVETLGRAAIAKMHDRPWGEESWEPIGRALVDAHAAGRAERDGEVRAMVETRIAKRSSDWSPAVADELRALLAQMEEQKP